MQFCAYLGDLRLKHILFKSHLYFTHFYPSEFFSVIHAVCPWISIMSENLNISSFGRPFAIEISSENSLWNSKEASLCYIMCGQTDSKYAWPCIQNPALISWQFFHCNLLALVKYCIYLQLLWEL